MSVGRVGVDTGGTFTDVVAADGTIAKVPSTPDDPSVAVAEGVERVGGAIELAHGTTVATNALLERRGARVALVTNAGFEDAIEIARQNRPSLYDPFADRPQPLVARSHRIGISGRVDAAGHEVEPLDPAVGGRPLADALPADTEAVAVVLLHADLAFEHERDVADELRGAGFDVSCSSEVAPEFREYERTATTVVNAYVRPVCRTYLQRLADTAPSVQVMSSAGGLLALDEAAEKPAALLLSGPAGGVRAAAAVAMRAGFPDAVTFDMGGTSTDVCLVLEGQPAPAAQREVAGFPIRMPSLDIHTIGAGGGSIAFLDPGGALRVGPRSAGALPGPACYGLGGAEPTVTDADLALGRMPEGASLPGLGTLDLDAARAALEQANLDAAGVVAVVDAAMVQAVRAVTVERGVDPRTCALVAFGGAGPLHACAIAEELDMPAVVVPPRAGVLSAVGMLTAPRQVDLVRSWPHPEICDADVIEDALVALATSASRALGGGAMVDVSIDCRYRGQSHEITVADIGDFPGEHRRRNGYERPDAPIEVVAVRASARLPSPVLDEDVPPPATRRKPVTGPAVMAEPDCTVWLPEEWEAEVHESGAWILRRADR